VLPPRALLRFITGFGLLNALADLATFGVLALALHGPDTLDDEAVFHSGWFTENLLTQALVMVLLRAGRLAVGRGPGPIAAIIHGASAGARAFADPQCSEQIQVASGRESSAAGDLAWPVPPARAREND